MAGAIIENMSGRKLAMIGSALLLCQILCFMVGAVISPAPNTSNQHLATKCYNPKGAKEKTAWFVPHGKKSCRRIESIDDDEVISNHLSADNVVFSIRMPQPRENTELDFSRWQQNLIGVMMMDVEYQEEEDPLKEVHLMVEARLGYRNKGDPEGEWKEYARSFEARNLNCDIDEDKRIAGYYYNCSMLPLFDLGSLHHDYYLLNIRLPTVYLDSENQVQSINEDLGKLVDIWLIAINQNGGFTKVWVSMKTIFFPIIILCLVWYWNRIHQLSRAPNLLEKTLFSLGLSLSFLNLPIEYFTLAYEMPWLNLFNDIKQGIFYANLAIFWLIFAGEHLISDVGVGDPNGLAAYWKNLSVVLFGCLCLFVFDMCERGVQLQNPFYSIWVTELGTNLALGFIILAGISAGLYFLFLCYLIRKVFHNIADRAASFQTMSQIRRLHYQGIIWRFKFLMLATLVAAALTVIGFIIGQVSEGAYKWDEDIGSTLQYSSGFLTGVYGMWNLYIFALLFLYAPSHKSWGNEDTLSTGEEVEFDVTGSGVRPDQSEMSSLTEFIRHQATD